jgi:hypothetical protein
MEEIMPHILERVKKIGAVNLGDIDHDIVMTDTDAAYSFVLGLFAATIFFASRAVEMAINTDDRMRSEEKTSRRKWLNLNRESLRKARDNGLPVNALFDTAEAGLDSDPVFVARRNKIAHGDIEGYKEATGFYQTTDFTKPYKLPVAPSEDEAYDQLTKSRAFLAQLTNPTSLASCRQSRAKTLNDT